DDPDAALAGVGDEGAKLVARRGPAGRIVGRVQEDGASAGAHRIEELVEVDPPAVIAEAHGDGPDGRSRNPHRGEDVRPGRRRHVAFACPERDQPGPRATVIEHLDNAALGRIAGFRPERGKKCTRHIRIEQARSPYRRAGTTKYSGAGRSRPLWIAHAAKP